MELNDEQRSFRTCMLSLVSNTVLAVAKISAGILGSTYVLIADGIESTLDIFSSIVVTLGVRFASKPPDEEHPYGHGKAEPFAGIIASVVLFIAAIGIGFQSIREIQTPHHAPKPFTLFVLVGVVLIKELLYRRVFMVGDATGSTALQAEAWHHRSDAITSVAAFLGIAAALMAGERFQSADDWAALVACVVIIYNGLRIFRASLAELMDTMAPEEDENAIREIARKVSGILEVEKCRVRKSGFYHLVELHIAVDGGMSVQESHDLAHQVKEQIRRSEMEILDVIVHVEPHLA